MMEGQNPGTSNALTVDSAVPLLQSLLSAEEDKKPRETQPTPEQSASEPEPQELPAEPEEPEAEEAAEAENTGEEAEPEEAESEQPAKYRVKVDGTEEEVTLDELLKGYSRTADYTRKTQAHAEKAKALEAEAQAVRTRAEQYLAGLRQLEEVLTVTTPQEPDWNTLRYTQDPEVFAQTWDEWQQHKTRMETLASQRTRVEQELAAANAEQLKARLVEEHAKLLEAVPDWKDAEKAKSEKAQLISYAQKRGFSAEELAAVTDHRALLLLRKAMLYDAAQENRPTVQAKIEKVKTATPGPGVKKKPVSDATKARLRLAQTGRVEDAAAVLKHLLD